MRELLAYRLIQSLAEHGGDSKAIARNYQRVIGPFQHEDLGSSLFHILDRLTHSNAHIGHLIHQGQHRRRHG